jgi:hypothetical protein
MLVVEPGAGGRNLMDHVFAQLADNAPWWVLAAIALVWIMMSKGPKWIATISQCWLNHRRLSHEIALSQHTIKLERDARHQGKKPKSVNQTQRELPLVLDYDLFNSDAASATSSQSDLPDVASASDDADDAEDEDRPDEPEDA